MPASPDTFTVTCNGIGAIGIDHVDPNTDPDEDIVYAFVWFRPRLDPGTVIWASGLTPPRGIQLDDVQARFSPEDGKLRTIIAGPVNEKQTITITGNPTGGTFTLTYSGQITAGIAYNAAPSAVQAALEALSTIAVGDVYVSGNVVNEKQTVTVNGNPTGGTFVLTFDGETTLPIPYNATNGVVQAYLQQLDTIGGIGVSVTGPVGGGGPWTIEFTGALAGQNVAQMTSAPRTEIQTITLNGSPTGGDYALTFNGQTTTAIAHNAAASAVQTALEALSNIGAGNVAVTGSAGGPYTVTYGGTLANQNVATLVPFMRNEAQTATITGSPTGGTFTLTYAGQTTAGITYNATASAVRVALENLSNISPGDVGVTKAGSVYTITFQNNLGNQNVTAMTASGAGLTGGSTPAVNIATLTEGIGLTGGATPSVTVATTQEHAALTGGSTPSIGIATTQAGSTGSPYAVTFQGALGAQDVALMTGSGAGLTPSGGVQIDPLVQGDSELGVKLVANTSLIDLDELIYDVDFEIPESDRIVKPFAILAPITTAQTVDLATVAKLPHRSELGL